MIELDGALGEGGGQILRSALSLSMITGQPFRIVNIRANRPKPGLMRQHLVAVRAAAEICGAQLTGAAPGATTLEFVPGRVVGGEYQFAIGTAGSCTLVLQTLLPALLYAERPSLLRISGGTHNPMAPAAQFLERAYGRVLATMGAEVEITLERFGFNPAGGGVISARVAPCAAWRRLDLLERGERLDRYAEAYVAGVSGAVGQRELEVIGKGMGWDASQLRLRGLPAEHGPGNALLLTLQYEHVTEVFSELGERSTRAENVAKNLLQQARAYLASGAAVGPHLCDQIMLPMALAGGGSFSTFDVTAHAHSNAAVIAAFLPVRFHFAAHGAQTLCTVEAI